MIFNRIYKKKETCGEYEWRHFACGWCALTFFMGFAWSAEHAWFSGFFWLWIALMVAAAICLVETIRFFTKADRIFYKEKKNG